MLDVISFINSVGKEVVVTNVGVMTYYNSDRATISIECKTKDGRRGRLFETTKEVVGDHTSKTIQRIISNNKREEYLSPILKDKVVFKYDNIKGTLKGEVIGVGMGYYLIKSNYGTFWIPNKDVEYENI